MKIIKKDDWDRKKSFIKWSSRTFKRKVRIKLLLICLGKVGRKDDYPEDVNLSESDIVLLYCKFLEEKNAYVEDKLWLIEDLVDFKEECTYHTTYKKGKSDYSSTSHC